MTAAAPTTGRLQTDPRAVNRATNITREQESSRPDMQAIRLGLIERTGQRVSLSSVKRLYHLFQAQGEAEIGFIEWVITYADPTGEMATDNVLWQQARGLARQLRHRRDSGDGDYARFKQLAREREAIS